MDCDDCASSYQNEVQILSGGQTTIVTYYYGQNGEEYFINNSGNLENTADPNDVWPIGNTQNPNPYELAVQACEVNCSTSTEEFDDMDRCALMKRQLIADVSPGGVYFDNIADHANGTLAPGTNPNDWLINYVTASPDLILPITIPANYGNDPWDYVRDYWFHFSGFNHPR